MPTILYYNDLIKKYKMNIQPFDINPIVGEYDDPEHQSQGIVTIPITRGGNTFILGASGMGKSTLLTTLIYSSIINHRPEEVNFYIMDFGSEKLKKFSKAPHVGDVLSINDKNKISYLFYMIDAEISKRRKYYSDNGGDFAQDVKNGKSVFQNIIVIIYGMEVFRETFEDVYDELFLTIIRNCSKFGINFIVSGASTSSLGYSAENSFPQKILLNLMDASDYQLYFTNPPLPSKNAGRGLVLIDEECMQFQTSLIFNEYDERKNLGYVIDKLNEICPIKAKSIPVVPKKLELKYLLNEIRTIDRVPLGINIMTAQIGYFNFNSKLCLMSASQSQILNKFMPKFIKILSLCANNNIIILNALDNVMIKTPQNIMYYNSNFKKVFPILTSNIKKMNDTPSTKNFTIIVLGYTNLNSHMTKLKEESKDINNVDDLIMMAKNNNFKFILFDVESLFRKITNGELSDLIDNQNGIWVGPDFDSQDIFEYERNSFMNQANPSNDTVVIVQDSISQYLKFPTI